MFHRIPPVGSTVTAVQRVAEGVMGLQFDGGSHALSVGLSHNKTACYLNDPGKLPSIYSTVRAIELSDVPGGQNLIRFDDGGVIMFTLAEGERKIVAPSKEASRQVAARWLGKTAELGFDQTLQTFLAYLKALHWLHWTLHWTSAGPASYSDHLLFERLYTGVQGEIDTFAEKIVGMRDMGIVSPVDSLTRTLGAVKEWEGEADPIQRAYVAENAFYAFLNEMLQRPWPPGMENFLQGVADTHDTHLYLLRQRQTSNIKVAKSNAKFVEIPSHHHPVEVLPPQIERDPYPFEGFIDFQGLKIDVENVQGSVRSGKGPEGEWSTEMFSHYGEIRDTEGVDDDPLDVYVGDNADSSLVVVIHQHNPWDGKYDEDKVMLGFDSVEEAIGAYKKQYDRPGFFRSGPEGSTVMPIGSFWRWVHDKEKQGTRVKLAANKPAALQWFGPFLDWAEQYLGFLTKDVEIIYDDWLDDPKGQFQSVYLLVQNPLPKRPANATPKSRRDEPADGKLGTLYRGFSKELGMLEGDIRAHGIMKETPSSAQVNAWTETLKDLTGALKLMRQEYHAEGMKN